MGDGGLPFALFGAVVAEEKGVTKFSNVGFVCEEALEGQPIWYVNELNFRPFSVINPISHRINSKLPAETLWYYFFEVNPIYNKHLPFLFLVSVEILLH